MEDTTTFYQYPWVISKLEHELYGLPAPYVQTMIAMPHITEVPHQSAWSRGVINLRGQVMPLVDLRRRLGMSPYLAKIEGLVDMVRQREQDHLNWMQELENSVREDREFTLTTDPHKCKFGQWYDGYRPVSLTESQLLQQFDAPHQRVHGLADRIASLAGDKTDQALSLIEQARQGDLATMQKLFANFSMLMRELVNSEIAMVLENMHRRTAVAVDAVESVEMLAEGTVEQMPAALQQEENPLAPFVAKRRKSGEIVYLVDAHRIIEENSGNH